MAEHKLDRRAGETDQQYDTRVQQAADDAGMSREEYEQAANAEAGRPAKREPEAGDTGIM